MIDIDATYNATITTEGVLNATYNATRDATRDATMCYL